jgi:hypothetical protein
MGRLSNLAAKAARKAAQKAAARASTPKPKKITTPDEGDWELPDLDEEVPIYTAPVRRTSLSVPAKPAPTRPKLEVYHGTPHRFAPETKVRDPGTGEELFLESARVDPANLPSGVEIAQQYPLGRFRMDRIGTGEGAQAFGHGLYFAENPDVARIFRDENLPHDAPNPMIGGEDAYALYRRIMDEADNLPPGQAQKFYDRAALLEDLTAAGDTLAIQQKLKRSSDVYSPEAVDWYNRNVEPQWSAPGSLYQVDLDVDPAKMLAWDVPVTEQPEVMQSVLPLLQKYQIEGLDDGKYPTLGGDLYHQLRMRSDVRDPAMSSLLTGAGIPGVRYLDQGSRNRGVGTENYVIMNPDLIEIMKRYNMGGKVEVNG